MATFPSAATAVQLAAARQAAQWSADGGARCDGAAAHDAGGDRAASDARGDARRAERTVSARAARAAEHRRSTSRRRSRRRETQGRLPGGRTPRGSFTWPKLAESSPARAEWTAPAAVAVAEQTQQAAPGTPLWGALPPLIAVSPSLAASAAPAGATTSARRAGGRDATATPRGDALGTDAGGGAAAWPRSRARARASRVTKRPRAKRRRRRAAAAMRRR